MPTEKKKIHAPHKKKNEKESIPNPNSPENATIPHAALHLHLHIHLHLGKGKKRPNEKHEYTRTLVTYVACMQRDIYIASREVTCFI